MKSQFLWLRQVPTTPGVWAYGGMAEVPDKAIQVGIITAEQLGVRLPPGSELPEGWYCQLIDHVPVIQTAIVHTDYLWIEVEYPENAVTGDKVDVTGAVAWGDQQAPFLPSNMIEPSKCNGKISEFIRSARTRRVTRMSGWTRDLEIVPAAMEAEATAQAAPDQAVAFPAAPLIQPTANPV